jgi:hypothetical protein
MIKPITIGPLKTIFVSNLKKRALTGIIIGVLLLAALMMAILSSSMRTE